ncbi:IS3 family transposase [Pectobacterium parmentieri]|uniref:IS3 family transposase n=4 Tax=Pectobacterium parmentieri TaxID=1905730 RepID=A0A8B3F9I5_PECPM|nr:IS3 family transposase [Pectobacterium parmentieri]PWD62346.1 IS3 family transposase [Pectobacterium parmentieri]RKO74026.1 IS3 family transposase [Pectobacterium parmentieri]
MVAQLSAFHAVKQICLLLNVSTRGYQSWRNRTPSQRQLSNDILSQRLIQLHRDSRGTYGIRRLQSDLQDEQRFHGKSRISRLMKQCGLKAADQTRYKVTTNSQHDYPIAPNLLNREFSPAAADVAWATDITYIRTEEGWLYLATVIDLYSRRIIGWSLSNRLKTQVVIDALEMAIRQRKPTRPVITHSDRGSQYASYRYRDVLKDNDLRCSMSGKGCCYDNAVMESFYHTLKTELMRGKAFVSREQAMNALFDYIEVFYNRRRKHSTLGYQTPVDYEMAA